MERSARNTWTHKALFVRSFSSRAAVVARVHDLVVLHELLEVCAIVDGLGGGLEPEACAERMSMRASDMCGLHAPSVAGTGVMAMPSPSTVLSYRKA